MNIIQIVDIILIIILFILGIEFMITLKKSEDKKIEKVRDLLIRRINIIIILTVIVGILTIVNILLKIK